MIRALKNSLLAIAALGVLGAVLWGWIAYSSTNAPRQYSLDYLTIATSLGGAKEFVEKQLNNRRISGRVTAALIQLDRDQVIEIRKRSQNLVHQVSIRDDGAIEVLASFAPKASASPSETVRREMVQIIFVPLQKRVGEFEWQCFGKPIEALPSTCKSAPNH